jgi:hypothetical protein
LALQTHLTNLIRDVFCTTWANWFEDAFNDKYRSPAVVAIFHSGR